MRHQWLDLPHEQTTTRALFGKRGRGARSRIGMHGDKSGVSRVYTRSLYRFDTKQPRWGAVWATANATPRQSTESPRWFRVGTGSTHHSDEPKMSATVVYQRYINRKHDKHVGNTFVSRVMQDCNHRWAVSATVGKKQNKIRTKPTKHSETISGIST